MSLLKRQPKTRPSPHLRPSQPAPNLTKQITNPAAPILARQIQDSVTNGQTPSLTPAQAMQLQREQGNQFVLGLLRPQTLQRAPTLDAQATQAERKELRVLTSEKMQSFSPKELKARFTDAAKPTGPTDDVQFDPQIKESLRNGLQNIANDMSNSAGFTVNTVTNMPLNLTPFGGVNGVYRFTMVQKPANKTRLIIEQVSAQPPAQLDKKELAAQDARLQQFDIKTGSGFGGGAARDQLLAALARVPDNLLEHVRGVTFTVTTLSPAGASGEPGHYDPNTHTIEFFANALTTTMPNSADAGGASRFIYSIMHELGHATDYEACKTLQRKVDDLTKQLKEAQLDARRATVDDTTLSKKPGQQDDKQKAKQDKIKQLQKDLNDAQTALSQAGTAPHSDGNTFKNAQGKAISSYGATAPVENFAELYSMFVLDPDLLKSIRPSAFDYFTRTLR